MVLLERCESVDGERVGLHGAAVEQDPPDVEAGGVDLGGEDELRRGGDHVHVVARADQVPHHLEGAGGVAEAVAGDVVGEDEPPRRRPRLLAAAAAAPPIHHPSPIRAAPISGSSLLLSVSLRGLGRLIGSSYSSKPGPLVYSIPWDGESPGEGVNV